MGMRTLKRKKYHTISDKFGRYYTCKRMTRQNKNKSFKKIIPIMAGRSELYE